MWDNYVAFNGSEIINAERFETYAFAGGANWFIPAYGGHAVSILENDTYQASWLDNPPWVDPDDPDTLQFWGVYPMNITGAEGSTRATTVAENIDSGGHISPLRYGTRSIVFEVMLAGASEPAVEAGFRWLKSALDETPCEDGCNGHDLCYFSADPCLDDSCASSPEQLAECSAAYTRTLRHVRVTSGPIPTAKRRTGKGHVIWVVTFTATAALPWEFGVETTLVEGFMVDADPWVPEVVPADWALSATAEDWANVDCSVPVYQPIVDPLCPAVEVPPEPPSIPLGCFEMPDTWKRRWFTIPRKFIPYWGEAAPIVRVQARSSEIRGLRLRFYADVNADASVLDDPCAYCGDILFSYIPANHTVILDAAAQQVYAEGPGGDRQRAESLVFATDGTPFDWPFLTCGFGYVVTVDFPSDSVPTRLPAVDLSVIPRVAA